MAEYIEREAALKALQGKAIEKYPLSFSLGLYAAADVIREMPTDDVAPVVRGRWIGSYDFHCSVCGVYQNFYTGRTNYCPNCGARMEGE